MFVRMRLRKWEDAFECKMLPFPINVEGAGVGFLEVYATVQDMQDAYPKEKLNYIEIQISEIV